VDIIFRIIGLSSFNIINQIINFSVKTAQNNNKRATFLFKMCSLFEFNILEFH